MIRKVILSFVILLLAGCKVAVLMVEGGEVVFGNYTGSGETCTAGNICFLDVPDTSSTTIFYAQPDEGWEFVRWNSGQNFWCPGSQNPLCELPLESLAGVPAVEDIVASDSTYYVMPIFQRVPPIITIGDKEWYQPTLFPDFTWHEVNAICPVGVCNGSLGGHDLTGWTWASTDDMKELLNDYIGHEALSSGVDNYFEVDSTWAPIFFESGWRMFTPPHLFPHSLEGWTSSEYSSGRGLITVIVDRAAGETDKVYNSTNNTKDNSYIYRGVWFYRPAP
jgi:hypothetical protein